MLSKTHMLGIALCTMSLSACMIDGANNYTDYHPYTLSQPSTLYPEGYESTGNYGIETPPAVTESQVVVPESYHVGAYHSPTPPKDMDRNWVDSQNPQAYTIELADGDKAARVASVLYKAPKTEHMAEIKYQRGGQDYYKGLYGTYPTYEAAQQALSSLPEDVKQHAGIKTWGSVQSNASH